MAAPPTSVAARPARGVGPATERPHWTRGDIFRAVLFGTLAILYAVLLFPLAVLIALFWAVGQVFESASSRPKGGRT